MRPQRPLMMRPQHPFWGKGLLVPAGLLGEGVLVSICWGRGSDAPPASTDAPPASFGEGVARTGLLGEGVLVSVCWGRGCSYRSVGEGGLMRPQRPLMGPQHPLGEGVLRCGGRNPIKGGFHPFSHQLLCNYSANPDNSSGIFICIKSEMVVLTFLQWRQ